jgi:hypothetical protein
MKRMGIQFFDLDGKDGASKPKEKPLGSQGEGEGPSGALGLAKETATNKEKNEDVLCSGSARMDEGTPKSGTDQSNDVVMAE